MHRQANNASAHRCSTGPDLSRVFVLATVSVTNDRLLLAHPAVSLVGIGKVLLGLQRVLEVIASLVCLILSTTSPNSSANLTITQHFQPIKLLATVTHTHIIYLSPLNIYYYGAVLNRRRPHHVLILTVCPSVCPSVCPVPPPREKTKKPTNTKLGRKGPWDTSTPWTNFKVKGSEVKVTAANCVVGKKSPQLCRLLSDQLDIWQVA